MKKFIGDKAFYKKVLAVALPIMLQNGISNFVSMLDNLMVGRCGTEPMSGVSIVNDLLFVFYLCLFGAISGAGIFTAQYYGQKNMKGVRDTFRIKIVICFIILILTVSALLVWKEPLIGLFLHEGSETGDLAATLSYGNDYLMIMLIGLLPVCITNSYASTLRETGETVTPMKASITAVFINLIFNYLLIYGKFGFPELGVQGAAIATVLSRFVEAAYILIWTKRHKDKVPYLEGAFVKFHIPSDLLKKVIVMGTPLLLNETLWAASVEVQKQSYSLRGLAVIAGMNIQSTLFNVLNVVFLALGDSVAIIVGQQLGAGEFDEAKDTSTKVIAMSTTTCVVLGVILAALSSKFPLLYNTTDEVRSLAADFILVSAALLPLDGFLHSTYFTIRSGGKTGITFLFDSGFMWVIAVPVAFVLTRYTSMPIIPIFAICQGLGVIKIIIGVLILRSGKWMNNIVG